RWLEQREVDRPGIQQQVELLRTTQRRAVHKRQVAVELAHKEAFQLASLPQIQQVSGDIRVAAQAELLRSLANGVTLRRCQQLGDYVDPCIQQKLQRIGVVEGDIVLLHLRVAQPFARLEEEF